MDFYYPDFIKMSKNPQEYPSRNKTLAYIIRKSSQDIELLVFTHRDFPEAGYQVPGGTLLQNETPLEGVLREVKEEAGLTNFAKIIHLGSQQYLHHQKEEIHHRSFYQLNYLKPCEDHFFYEVSDGEEDQGLIFYYQWVNLLSIPKLAVNQDALIGQINW